VKPLMALLVDTFPIWGYHKRYYVVITACLAVICNLLLALLPADASWADASLALAFLFAVPVFECALTDLICEGVYARVMRENPDSSADIPTYANTILNIGGLIAPQLVGHLADTKGPKFVFFIGAVFGAPIVIPALLGWQPEKKVPQKGTFCWCGKPAYDSLKANWRIMLCGFIIGMLALAQAIISAIIGDEGLGNTIVGVIFAVIVIVASILLLPRTIALYNIYSFFNVWWMNLFGTVGQFAAFYQGSEACMPGDEAPHFSNVQYISNASLVNSLLSLISMWAAGVCFRNMRLRTLLWFTSFLSLSQSTNWLGEYAYSCM